MARSERRWMGLAVALLMLAPAKGVFAQELPVLDPMHTQLILQEVSGYAA